MSRKLSELQTKVSHVPATDYLVGYREGDTLGSRWTGAQVIAPHNADAGAHGMSASGRAVLTGTPAQGMNALRSTDPIMSESCAFLGDSLTYNNPAYKLRNENSDACNSWAFWLCYISGGRFYMQNNAGHAGDTTAQMLTRVADVTARPARKTFILAGTNDAGVSVATATTLANIRSIIDAIKTAGSEPILLTIPGCTGTDRQNLIDAINFGLVEIAREKNCRLIDFGGFLTNPLTRAYKTEYNHDNVHFKAAAAKAVAAYVLSALGYSPSLAQASCLTRNAADFSNIITDPLCLSLTGTTLIDGTPYLTRTLVAGPVIGNVLQFGKTAPNSSTLGIVRKSSAVTVGNRMRFSCRLKATGFAASAGTYSIYIQWAGLSAENNIAPIHLWNIDIPNTTVVAAEFVVPAGATAISLYVSAAGLGTLELSELGLFVVP